MRSSARKWFHLGPRLGLLLVVLWSSSVGGCRDDVTDVASQALLAPVVIEATVLGPVHTLREAAIVRHYVNVRVDKVHKGPVKDKTHVTLHFFGSDHPPPSSRNNHNNNNNNGLNSNYEDACALQPRAFEKGRKYIVFADVSENYLVSGEKIAENGDAPGSDNVNFTIHSVPAPRNKTSSRQVRKILCKKCGFSWMALRVCLISALVIALDGATAFAPSLNGFKKHVRVNESGPMKLVCKFAGKPLPKIQWFKDGEIVKQMSHLSIVTTKKKSSLTIRKAKPRDSGEYECRATNVIGPPVSMKTKVKVVAKPPTATTTPRKFDNRQDKQACDPNIEKEFCHHGGKCFVIISLSDMMCECQPGYEGVRCESKVVDHVPENRKEYMCDTNILTYVVVILGVILFVTILGNLAYFILRKKRKMHEKKKKVSARRRRRLSGEDLENIIYKGDTIEMAQLQQENAKKSQTLLPLELSSDNEQDKSDGAGFLHISTKVSTEILTNLASIEIEPGSIQP